MERHTFETIFTYNDVVNIKDTIVKGCGYLEIAYSMQLKAYFNPIVSNKTHATHNYGPIKSNFEFYYYRQTYFFH